MEVWLRNIILGNELSHFVRNLGLSEDWRKKQKHKPFFSVMFLVIGPTAYTVGGRF